MATWKFVCEDKPASKENPYIMYDENKETLELMCRMHIREAKHKTARVERAE